MAHECGHWMQYEEYGPLFFYGAIAPASIYFAKTHNHKGWTKLEASNNDY